MKIFTSGVVATFLAFACSSPADGYLVKFYEGEFDEMGAPSGYLNASGDTIIPSGKYFYAYTDTIRDFGMVMEDESGKILGINQNGTELFEVFRYDNGPDYVASGLFRIIKDGKIGYANPSGEIVIAPNFACAYPFEGDFAKVADNCETEIIGEHSSWVSDGWYQIGRDGKRVE
ncbi:WG repeat-containing protein [Neolewinella lacunae]|uniref:WG repeat-containing protein n=1 Tax=Neolewinella lacunae TaxID=1517758 RepID=A0A923PJ78_9BACT|nr:WG repeat-containing protein [Neolewinella lacunae]MBC6993575.1 WG repeat-containing protein [Neolewinella lacunae]MDN3636150.1 WG repeat-containing protein [Neolewinella lacunae]